MEESILDNLAPNIQDYATKRGESAVQGELKKPFQIQEFSMGKAKPKLANKSTHSQAGAVFFDFEIDWHSDCSIKIKVLGITAGVRDLTLKGRGRIVLKPKVPYPPFFGGIQFYLLDDVEVNFDLVGAANVGDWQIVRKSIRKAIVKEVRKSIVYPNKAFMPTSSKNPMGFRRFEPIAIMAVKVDSGSDLPRKGSESGCFSALSNGLRNCVGQADPDPYVKIRAGAYKHKTSVVKDSANPIWDNPEWAYFIMEASKGHKVSLTVFDWDRASKDEFLGKAWISVDSVAESEGEQEMTLTLEDSLMDNPKGKKSVSGELTVTTKWMPIDKTEDEAAVAVLTVSVYSFDDPETEDTTSGEKPEISVSIEVTDQKTQTTEKEEKSKRTEFNQSFCYIIKEVDKLDDTFVALNVIEKKNTVGSLQLSLEDFKETPIDKQDFNLDGNEDQTLRVSAKVEYA